MPIFEFSCGECKKTFESLTKPFEPVACALCGTKEVNKVWSTKTRVSHQMKGDNGASTTPARDRGGRK